MNNFTEWCTAQSVPHEEALAGEGCTEDEAKALAAYLNGETGPEEAAIAITASVLKEQDPAQELYRLWGLLCDAMVHLPIKHDALLDLLCAIQCLPPSRLEESDMVNMKQARITWDSLAGFANIWSDVYRAYVMGPEMWEAEYDSMDPASKKAMQERFANEAEAEARMFLLGLGGVPAQWGFDLLNLSCQDRKGLEPMIYGMHRWLVLAGDELRKQTNIDEVLSFTTKGHESANFRASRASMSEHWLKWALKLKDLGERSNLSGEAKSLALKCSQIMVSP